MFKAIGNRGFHTTFANGWTVSVQWGTANSCERLSGTLDFGSERKVQKWESKDAEVAAWDSDGRRHNFGNGTVEGWLTSDEVLAFMKFVAEKEPKHNGGE